MTLALALAAIALSGAALSRGLPVRPALRIALAAALGLGAWSAAYSLLLFCGGDGHQTWKDVALALGGAAVLFRESFAKIKNSKLANGTHAPSPPWLRAVFAVALVIFAALVVEHLVHFPDGGWDAKMIWNLRARFLARGGFERAFSPHMLFWAHQDYPLLVPGAVGQLFLAAGSESVAWSGAFGLACALLAVAVLTLTVAELRGASAGLLAGLALLTTPCLIALAANQQADVPMGCYVLLTAALIALSLEGPRPLLLLAGFAGGLAAWTKNEGLVYFACFTVALAWRSSLKDAARFLLGALPMLALLAVFKLRFAHTSDLAGFSTTAELFGRLAAPSRWVTLFAEWARRLVYFQDVAVWVVAELALLLWLRPKPGVLGTALLLGIAAWAPVYVLQPHPLAWFIRASISRLFIQVWPAILLATALAAAPRPAPATADT